ncbi:unnamed protein product [marine sediment metagenome]|uniref:Glycosyl transferase family 1 domain-containing protein n=2 Tax=marine sediment metagenome TaxID=412755 RepID=X1DV95_9ZZZZ
MKKYSYVMIGDPMAVRGTKTLKEPLLSGLWLWHKAFDKFGKKGEVRLLRRKGDFEDYSCIHLNMTGGNLGLLHRIRDELGDSSSTKIVCNLDFDVSAWGRNWMHPTLLEKELQCADILFHVEPVGASVLEFALKRKVYCLPHPVDIDNIDSYKTDDMEPYTAFIFHRYYPDITIPYFAIRDLPLYSVLLGYKGGNVPALTMYDQYYGYLPFIEMIEAMSLATLGLDLFHGYSYGRAVCEFAALAVPCVCSETIAAGQRCFPDLVVKPFDIKKTHDLMEKLLKDKEFYQSVYTKAYKEVAYYSLKNCYERMAQILEEIEAKK